MSEKNQVTFGRFRGILRFSDHPAADADSLSYEIRTTDLHGQWIVGFNLISAEEVTGLIEMLIELRDECIPEMPTGRDWWYEHLQKQQVENKRRVEEGEREKHARRELVSKMKSRIGRRGKA